MLYTVQHTRHSGSPDRPAFTCARPVGIFANSLIFAQHPRTPWLVAFDMHAREDLKFHGGGTLCAYDVSEADPYALLLFGEEPSLDATSDEISVGGRVRLKCSGGSRLLPLLE